MNATDSAPQTPGVTTPPIGGPGHAAVEPAEPLRLSADDLYSPRVEAFLDEQAMMSRALPEVEPLPWILRVLYSSYLYLSLASGLGAFVAWLIMEPFFVETASGRSRDNFTGRTSCCFLWSPARSGCSWARPRGSCAATRSAR